MSGNSSNRLEIARNWGRLCRYGSLALLRLPSRMRRNADLERIDRLGKETAAALERDPACAAKYADHPLWIPFNVNRVGALALHRSMPLRILDIGCGPGYFLAAALACGHDCYGIDAPASVMSDVEVRVYSEMLASLSVREACLAAADRALCAHGAAAARSRLNHRVLDMLQSPSISRTNGERRSGASSCDDALSHLRDGGVLHLELNANPERYRSLQWYDQETLDYFRSAGTVERNIVRITKGKPQEWGTPRSRRSGSGRAHSRSPAV